MRRAVFIAGFAALIGCGETPSGSDAGLDSDVATIDAGSDGGSVDGGSDAGIPLVRSTDFAEASGDVRNPDRGFYWWDWNDESPLVLVKPQLGDYCNTPTLPSSVIDEVRTRLAGHRDAGRRVILRFVYSDSGDLNACGRADAMSIDIVLGHVMQLRDVLREHTDVIAFLEAGFFGMWGEWNSEHAPAGTTLWTDATNRERLIRALLESLAAERPVLVRRPRFRDETAFTAAELDRIGFHNDCFLASDTDYGTYDGDRDIEGWKTYIREATPRVPIGGETCNDDPTYTACPNATAEMERLRFAYLHEGYHPDVITRWGNEGCLEEIRQRIGYRIVLRALETPVVLSPGGPLLVRLELENVGYAPPYSTRRARLVLRSGDQVRVLDTTSAIDTRDWAPGSTLSAELRATLPSDLTSGTWEIRLALLEDVSDLPDYALLFANDERVRDDVLRENVLATFTVP